MKAPNRLSVGELLLEGDLTARRLLLDPDALDAAAMVRTWPEVVQAGHEFLAILPRRGGEACCGGAVAQWNLPR